MPFIFISPHVEVDTRDLLPLITYGQDLGASENRVAPSFRNDMAQKTPLPPALNVESSGRELLDTSLEYWRSLGAFPSIFHLTDAFPEWQGYCSLEVSGHSGLTIDIYLKELGSSTSFSEKVKVLVIQSCLTLCDPMNYSPPGSSVHGILLARILEWAFFPLPSPGNLPDSGISPGYMFSSVQVSCSVVSNSLQPHGLQHARPPCPSPITNTQSLLKLMSIELVMPSNYLILCCPLLLLPSIFPSIRVFSNESILHIRWPKYWNFSFSISPSNAYSGLISLRMDSLVLLAVQGTLKSLLQHHSSKTSILHHQVSL